MTIIIIYSCGNTKSLLNDNKPQYILHLTNGDTIAGNFKIRNSYFLDKPSGNKISYDSVRKYIYYGYDKPYTYYMIHTKKYKEVTKISRGAGYKIYHGKKVDLFHGIFHNGLTPKRSIKYYNPDFETYAKKKGDLYSYSIRIMDGIGLKDVKKRLFDFFYDCPELIKKIKNNEINELDTIRIVEYYENECGKTN